MPQEHFVLKLTFLWFFQLAEGIISDEKVGNWFPHFRVAHEHAYLFARVITLNLGKANPTLFPHVISEPVEFPFCLE